MGFNHYSLLLLALVLLFALAAGYLFRLVILALLKYLRSGEVRKEKAETKKTLGEALKAHRTRCKMTQEFVAESLGVSRQAVSKWESGASTRQHPICSPLQGSTAYPPRSCCGRRRGHSAHRKGVALNYYLSLAALVPAVILFVRIYQLDRIEKEPRRLLGILLLSGALLALPAAASSFSRRGRLAARWISARRRICCSIIFWWSP